MTDYISREAAMNFKLSVTADPTEIQAITKGMALYAEHIKSIPAADVAPVVRGKWEVDGHHIRCTNCGEYMCAKDQEGIEIPREFCPNCGAKMDGGAKDAVD